MALRLRQTEPRPVLTSLELTVEPMFPRSVQAGTPHTSTTDLGLAQHEQGAWANHMCSRRVWFWTSPEAAPLATATVFGADSQFTVFELAGGTGETAAFRVPWLMHKQASAIDLLLTIAQPAASSPKDLVSVKGVTLFTSITETQTARILVTGKQATPRGIWTRGEELFTLGMVKVRLTPVDIPSDRRLLLQPFIRHEQFSKSTLTAGNNSTRLYAMRVSDVILPPLIRIQSP